MEYSDPKIFILDTASEQETYSAHELQYYLERMLCRPLEIVHEPAAGVIAIGGAAAVFGVGFAGSADGFELKTIGDAICVTGGVRGVIYGVYELLERLGCRFFAVGCEVVPQCGRLVLPELNEHQEPDFAYREHNYYEPVVHSRFAVKLRLNGGFHPIREKHGGHIEYQWFVHSMEEIFPPEEFAVTHPEYYAMGGDGLRDATPHKNQMCLSNPELVPIAIDRVRKALRAHPAARIVSVSQNDWVFPCQCAACRAIEAEEGSPSGAMLRFVNQVAEALEPEFPEVLFDTLAYQYTRRAPLKTVPRANVCVRLCSIECCFAHSFEECTDTSRGSFLSDLRSWGALGGKLFIWDYTTCFNFYPTPHPNWRSLQPNMQLFLKNGVYGVFEQANGSSRGGTDFNELRAYLISKLLWNVNADLEKHRREFLSAYYGAAADCMREYLDALCDNAQRAGSHVGFNDPPFHAFLNDECLTQYEEIFLRARQRTAGDAISLYRVAKAELSLRYVRLVQSIFQKKIVPANEMNSFFTDWNSFGLTRMEEWCSPQTTHRAFLRGCLSGSRMYQHWAAEGEEEL